MRHVTRHMVGLLALVVIGTLSIQGCLKPITEQEVRAALAQSDQGVKEKDANKAAFLLVDEAMIKQTFETPEGTQTYTWGGWEYRDVLQRHFFDMQGVDHQYTPGDPAITIAPDGQSATATRAISEVYSTNVQRRVVRLSLESKETVTFVRWSKLDYRIFTHWGSLRMIAVEATGVQSES